MSNADVLESHEHYLSEKSSNHSYKHAEAPFFAVSLTKFVVMSICTFGIYELYWFYRNWLLIKERESLDIKPFWRAFFAYFYCVQCFTRIRSYAVRLELPISFSSAGLLATGWMVITLTWKLPDPYWLLTFLSFIPMLPVQALANCINQREAPTHFQNSRFTGWNIAMVIVGGLLVILAVIGTFLPERQ